MKDFLRTVMVYAERNGCVAQPLDDISSFNWSGPLPKPTIAQLEEFESTVLDEEARIEGIKNKASTLILTRYPIWKQNNLHMRFTELVDKAQSGQELTPEEQLEKEASRAVWTWVKLVRVESDRLEGIAGATANDGNWPA